MTLTPVMQKFILHWGEMGTRWGINRTVAQIHALLYISPRPLTAEEIAQTLDVARSNVSTSLRELQNWGIVKVMHIMGDRRDHYETLKDVWQMFQIILDERKRREIDPTLDVLRECVEQTGQLPGAESEPEGAHLKLANLLEFLEASSMWYTQIRKLPASRAFKVMRMGKKLRKALADAAF
jgi:DNA-binding transcriptional regulator GbsR (MarR family)